MMALRRGAAFGRSASRMKSPANVSLRAVAQAAGVSVSTASYALRNDPRLRPETCQRIQALAQQLGYRSNPIFSAMMVRARQGARRRGTTGQTVAYLSAFPSREQWTRVFPQPAMFEGARVRAEALNFHLEPFFFAEKKWPERRLQQVLVERGIRGVIVSPFAQPSGELPLDWSRFAAATIGFTLAAPRLHRVTSDHFYNMRLAISSARAAGFKRIGCVLPRAISPRIDQQWMAATTLEMAAHGMVPALALPPEEWNAASVWKWYREYEPDFIVTRRNHVAGWLREKLGKRAPLWAELSVGPDTTADGGIDEHAVRIGAFAFDLVLSQLQHNDYGVPANPTLTLIPGDWAWRNPPPAAR